ncbi:Reverse transcriptase precursor [Pelomyxa schiedti]|nr:Reverse transcriptase precursor [Pelomyxa schiedti]
MEGRMSKVQILWENQALDIIGVYAPYLGHPEATDFWEHANKKYTPSNTSATILIGDFNIPLFKYQHPSFERSANLRQAAMSTMENCIQTYKRLLTKAAWQTMNNHNNTQQDTLSALLKLQKASATEALTIIERNKEVADLFDYYPPSPDQIQEAITWVKTQLDIKIPKKKHTPFPEIPARSNEITKEFWAPLLGPISSDGEALKTLLSKYRKKLGPFPMLTPDDVEAAILSCKSKSAPGPDGISFAAWKTLPKLSTIILCNMFHWLTEHTAPPHFNDSLFFSFLKVEGTTRIDESRPISPPNTDNRIITKTMAYLLNPLIAQLCHPNQNGFFEGRLIDDNITAVANTFYTLKNHNVAAQFLFTDFSKAYDNLDRNAIIHILGHVGMPQSWTNVITHLMQDTEAYLPSGIHFPLRGVQQGCPLSPLIFNVVIDTLLMNLQCSPAKPKVSAYADDICTAWRNLKYLDTGAPTFDLYCRATGASLNFRKTEVLAASPSLAKDKTLTAWPVQTVTKYKYLGVYIGHITD